MATSRQQYRLVIGPQSVDGGTTSASHLAYEQALYEVEQTLLNIEEAIRRAHQSSQAISPDGDERDLRLALDRTAEQLETVRKKLFQSGYFGGHQQRLICGRVA